MKFNKKYQSTLHPFHIVRPSPWPILSAFSAFATTVGATIYFHYSYLGLKLLILGLVALLFSAFCWWGDVIYEGHSEGEHTKAVQKGLRSGMLLFILSEVFFFIAFFWAFFHSSLSPALDIGFVWPPKGIHPFCPVGVPAWNTIILLSSGVFVTWAHHSLEINKKETEQGLLGAILLGVFFSFLQAIEYKSAKFAINDSIYGSVFYFLTGFHGLHVLIGTLFLIVCLLRVRTNNFRYKHHVGFEAAIWYWHFVDVVWLFLFVALYIWGGRPHNEIWDLFNVNQGVYPYDNRPYVSSPFITPLPPVPPLPPLPPLPGPLPPVPPAP